MQSNGIAVSGTIGGVEIGIVASSTYSNTFEAWTAGSFDRGEILWEFLVDEDLFISSSLDGSFKLRGYLCGRIGQ